MRLSVFLIILPLCFVTGAVAQNVGIGTSSPSEKLEVGGIIYANDGGIKFPDGSLQQTAAFNQDIEQAAESRLFVVMSVDDEDFTDVLDTAGVQGCAVIDLDYELAGNYEDAGGGGAQYVLNIGPVRTIKEIDVNTPFFHSHVALGTPIVKVELYFLRESGDLGLEYYLKLTLNNVLVSRLNPGIRYQGDGSWAHLEELELTFDSFDVEYQ